VGKRKVRKSAFESDQPDKICLPRDIPMFHQTRAQMTIPQWVEKTLGPGPWSAEQQAMLQKIDEEAIAMGLVRETAAYFAFLSYAIQDQVKPDEATIDA
jgi:hypothetical protein